MIYLTAKERAVWLQKGEALEARRGTPLRRPLDTTENT
jgi:hypothetical protein